MSEQAVAPLMISVSEAARRLGIGLDRAYELVKSGELASVPNGTRNRKVPVYALEQYVRSATRGGIEE